VQSLLKAVDAKEQRYSIDLAEPIIEDYKLEFLCEDGAADQLVQVVAMAGRTGQTEAGWVYVTSVESAIRIGGR
jgi:nitrogen regulatory protein P-II 1